MSSGVDNAVRLGRRLMRTELSADDHEFVDNTSTRLLEVADVLAAHRRSLDELWSRLDDGESR